MVSFRPITGVVLPALLLGSAFGAWKASDAADRDTDLGSEIDHGDQLLTPVLSARRIPETMSWPVVRDDLASHGQDAVADSPATSCVVLRTLEREVYSANADLPLIPASNQKLVTTYVALEVLGPDTTFSTAVDAAVEPDAEGVVNGDLYLIGGGDPFLSTEEWRSQYSEASAPTLNLARRPGPGRSRRWDNYRHREPRR